MNKETEKLEKVESIDHAFEIMGLDRKALPIVDHMPEQKQRFQVMGYELEVAFEAQNKLSNFEPDFMNESQWKYWAIVYPVKTESGLGLALYGVDSSGTLSDAGSRLCAGSEADVRHLFKTFKSHFEAIHINTSK